MMTKTGPQFPNLAGMLGLAERRAGRMSSHTTMGNMKLGIPSPQALVMGQPGA